jgi:hypothetical protein
LRKLTTQLLKVGVAVAVAATTIPGETAAAQPSTTSHTARHTLKQVLGMTPQQQAVYLQPLRDLAAALDQAGGSSYGDIYTNAIIDIPTYRVTGGPVMVDVGWAAAEGDSSGMVFALTSNGTQARGQVSSGLDSVSSGGFNAVCWIEAPDILNHYGLTLNPNT